MLCPWVEASEVGRGEAFFEGVCPGIASTGGWGACLEIEEVAEDWDDSGGVDGEWDSDIGIVSGILDVADTVKEVTVVALVEETEESRELGIAVDSADVRAEADGETLSL